VYGKLAAIAAFFALLVVPVAHGATTDIATAQASPGPYLVGSPITFTSTTPCTVPCRLVWTYLNGTRLGDSLGEGDSVVTSFATPGLKTVELRLTELCVGTTRLVCDSIVTVTVNVESAPNGADTTAPTITAAGLEAEATGPTTNVSYAFGATDPDDAVVSSACSPAPGSAFALGETPVGCTATDSHGNVGTASFSVAVRDTTGPAVTTPTTLAAEATSPAGAAVSYDASAVDLVDGPVPTTCSTPSSSTFALGVTTVTCSATDAHGNLGFARFEVAVVDSTPPSLALPGAITREATSADGAVVDYSATASDTVDGAVTAACSMPSGATFPIGSTTVTCTAADVRGNTSTGSFVVNVVDSTAPALTVPGSIVVNATSPRGAAVTYDASAVDFIGGVVTPDCSTASGAVFAIGTTTVTCTATDTRGNTSRKSFTVQVKGAVEQLRDVLQVVLSWHVKWRQVEIQVRGPLWALTQPKPKVNLACKELAQLDSRLQPDGDLGSKLTAAQRDWLRGELARISAVVGCAPRH
jgi:HYR domain